MAEIVYEVIMRKKESVGERIHNAFFGTLRDAERHYHEYVALDWAGDVFRCEIEV